MVGVPGSGSVSQCQSTRRVGGRGICNRAQQSSSENIVARAQRAPFTQLYAAVLGVIGARSRGPHCTILAGHATGGRGHRTGT